MEVSTECCQRSPQEGHQQWGDLKLSPKEWVGVGQLKGGDQRVQVAGEADMNSHGPGNENTDPREMRLENQMGGGQS